LRDLPAVAERYADSYAAFRATYCSLEDGHATDRALDLLGLA
jgi:CDP-glycerol glycerophosphotransferase